MIESIDRTQHLYQAMPLLVDHMEKVYEHYISK